MTTKSYIYSHTEPGKGVAYDSAYATDPLRRYLWSREQWVLHRILNDFFADRPVDLLDFACGTGRILSALETKVRSSTGVDVSDEMLEVARKKLQRTELHKANLLQDHVFPEGRFNLITAFRFFLNAEPELRAGALRALTPLLAQEGYLVFNNHQNSDSPYFRLARVYARLRKMPPANMMSMSECDELLAGVGFEIVRVFPVGFLHVPKINLPHALYRLADRVSSIGQNVASASESPIIVARRRGNR